MASLSKHEKSGHRYHLPLGGQFFPILVAEHWLGEGYNAIISASGTGTQWQMALYWLGETLGERVMFWAV